MSLEEIRRKVTDHWVQERHWMALEEIIDVKLQTIQCKEGTGWHWKEVNGTLLPFQCNTKSRRMETMNGSHQHILFLKKSYNFCPDLAYEAIILWTWHHSQSFHKLTLVFIYSLENKHCIEFSIVNCTVYWKRTKLLKLIFPPCFLRFISHWVFPYFQFFWKYVEKFTYHFQ